MSVSLAVFASAFVGAAASQPTLQNTQFNILMHNGDMAISVPTAEESDMLDLSAAASVLPVQEVLFSSDSKIIGIGLHPDALAGVFPEGEYDLSSISFDADGVMSNVEFAPANGLDCILTLNNGGGGSLFQCVPFDCTEDCNLVIIQFPDGGIKITCQCPV